MTPPASQMIDDYTRRTTEHENVYQKSERQPDLRRLESRVTGAFSGKEVLEIACGTGYWTQFIARSAASVLAIDGSAEVLAVAREKEYGACHLDFVLADACSLPGIEGAYGAGFCGFWWSHISRDKISDFLSAFHARLADGATVILIDDRYVEGSSAPICRLDEHGNTYQLRRLSDDTEYEVLKDFPTDHQLTSLLASHGSQTEVEWLEYYWIGKYRLCRGVE